MAVPRIYSSDNLGPATDYMENNSNVTAAVRQNDVGYPSLSPMVPTETRLSRLDATNDRSLNNRSSFSFGTREGVTHIPSEPMPAPPNSMAAREQSYWMFGLFDCFSEPATWITALICPCFVYGKIKQKLLGTTDPYIDCCYFTTTMMCCCVGLPACSNAAVRSDIRSMGNFEEDTTLDCLLSYACLSCTLVQQKRQVDAWDKIGFFETFRSPRMKR